MTALAAERNTLGHSIKLKGSYPVKANTKIFKGSLVGIYAGYAQPASTQQGMIPLGRAKVTADNTGGSAGAISVEVESGVFKFAKADTFPAGATGFYCYLADDQTVRYEAAGTESPCGIAHAVESDGVYVAVGTDESVSTSIAIAQITSIYTALSDADTALDARVTALENP